jgi:DNA-binding CsgD family transcriptional regulator
MHETPVFSTIRAWRAACNAPRQMTTMTFDPYDGILHTTGGATTDYDARARVWNDMASGELGVVLRGGVYTFERGASGTPLSATERAAALAAARALPGKQIAFALGVAASTVSGALSSAAAKLGLESPAELARLVRALVVAPLDDCEAALSLTEREVAVGILDGKSNSEIACARGRSVHTIAKQVASILRKTGSPSRHVLRVRFGHKSG